MLPMTPEEKVDYNHMTIEGQKFYDFMKGEHPDWTHAQLITVVWMTFPIRTS